MYYATINYNNFSPMSHTVFLLLNCFIIFILYVSISRKHQNILKFLHVIAFLYHSAHFA